GRRQPWRIGSRGRALCPACGIAIRKRAICGGGMNAYVKSGLTLAGVVLALALYFALRLALADGMFTPIDPVLPVCGPIAQGLGGANDLESDPGHGAMFLSARSGLYRLASSNTVAAPVKLAGAPGDLHSVGISFY